MRGQVLSVSSQVPQPEGCSLSEARLHLRSQMGTLQMPLLHLKTPALHLIRDEDTAFLGCGWSVCAQPGPLEDAQVKQGRMDQIQQCEKKQGIYSLVLHFGCTWRSVLENQVYLYTSIYPGIFPNSSHRAVFAVVLLCHQIRAAVWTALSMQCFKHTSYYGVASLPFQSS